MVWASPGSCGAAEKWEWEMGGGVGRRWKAGGGPGTPEASAKGTKEMVVSLLRWSSGSRQSRLLCLDMLGSRCLFAIQVEVYLDSWTLSLEFRSSWGVGTGASPRRLPVSPRQADSWFPGSLGGGGVRCRATGPPDGRHRQATARWLLSLSSEPVLQQVSVRLAPLRCSPPRSLALRGGISGDSSFSQVCSS